MASKRKSPCTAATVAGAREKSLNEHFTPEFDDCQAEHIWKHDMRILIGACIVIILLAILGVI